MTNGSSDQNFHGSNPRNDGKPYGFNLARDTFESSANEPNSMGSSQSRSEQGYANNFSGRSSDNMQQTNNFGLGDNGGMSQWNHNSNTSSRQIAYPNSQSNYSGFSYMDNVNDNYGHFNDMGNISNGNNGAINNGVRNSNDRGIGSNLDFSGQQQQRLSDFPPNVYAEYQNLHRQQQQRLNSVQQRLGAIPLDSSSRPQVSDGNNLEQQRQQMTTHISNGLSSAALLQHRNSMSSDRDMNVKETLSSYYPDSSSNLPTEDDAHQSQDIFLSDAQLEGLNRDIESFRTALNKTCVGHWRHNTGDFQYRRVIILRIAGMIQRVTVPNASSYGVNDHHVPHLAKKLEECLYRTAKTKEEYTDSRTLKARLRRIIKAGKNYLEEILNVSEATVGEAATVPYNNIQDHLLSRQTYSRPESSFSDIERNEQLQPQSIDPDKNSAISRNIITNNDTGGSDCRMNDGFAMAQRSSAESRAKLQSLGSFSSGSNQHRLNSNLNGFDGFDTGAMSRAQLDPASIARLFMEKVNSSSKHLNENTDKNELNGSIKSDQLNLQSSLSLEPSLTSSSSLMNIEVSIEQSRNHSPHDQHQVYQSRSTNLDRGQARFHVHSSQLKALTTEDANQILLAQANGLTSNQNPMPPMSKNAVQQQQHRLLLLRHSSKCTLGVSCRIPSCFKMSTLWRHLQCCHDSRCQVSHCISSRLIIKHFSQCKESGSFLLCDVCAPIALPNQEAREIVAKNFIGRSNQDITQKFSERPNSIEKIISIGNDSVNYFPPEELQSQNKARPLMHQDHRKESQESTPPLASSGDFSSIDQETSSKTREQVVEKIHQGSSPGLSIESVKYDKLPSQIIQSNQRSNEITNNASATGHGLNETNINDQDPKSQSTKRCNVELGLESNKLMRLEMPSSSQGDHNERARTNNMIDIESHIKSLSEQFYDEIASTKIVLTCLPVIDYLMNHQDFGWIFSDEVDPIALGIPDYFKVIKTPIYFSLIRSRLLSNHYESISSFRSDVCLVFENAILYNGEGSDVGHLARVGLDEFEKAFITNMNKRQSRLNHPLNELCILCGKNDLEDIAPSEVKCDEDGCTQLVSDSQSYYCGRSKSICEKCYSAIQDSDVKASFFECKCGKPLKETWIKCSSCSFWTHKKCTLFHERYSRFDGHFTCLHCRLDPNSSNISTETVSPYAAESLPSCDLSQHIERGIRQCLSTVADSDASVEKTSLNSFSVRVLSNESITYIVGKETTKRIPQIPKAFPLKRKCLALFCKIEGVDVLVFCVFVDEYDQTGPKQNSGRIFLTFLESIPFLKESSYRMTIYSTFLIEYFRYMKEIGFRSIHIWACPPPQNQSLFNCPSTLFNGLTNETLYNWFSNILNKAKEENVVVDFETLHDEVFGSMNGSDISDVFETSLVPILEHDYLSGQIEELCSISIPDSLNDSMARKIENMLKSSGKYLLVAHLQNFNDSNFEIGTSTENNVQASAQSDDTSDLGSAKLSFASLSDIPDHNDSNNNSESIGVNIFSSRQHFLNFCQRHSLQFNDLRQAKYSSISILYYLLDKNERKTPRFNKSQLSLVSTETLRFDEKRRKLHDSLVGFQL